MEANVIVKVQRPVFTGGVPARKQADILIYDQEREHEIMAHLHHLPKWMRKALEREPKLFAEAEWTGAGWRFEGPAGWQSW